MYFSINTYILFSQDIGSPFSVYYSPKEYLSSAQVWSIVEDKRGIMYFGTTMGLTEFDGKFWQNYLLPKKSNVRSLLKTKNDRIYYGGSGEFGYFEYNNKGELNFADLTLLIESNKRTFADVWEIATDDKFIYFISTQFLFRYNEQ